VATQIYLSLGSNLGDRMRNLSAALGALAPDVQVVSVSSLYETEPVGVLDQPAFLNMALAAETSLDPFTLLQAVKRVEEAVGRTPTFRWGPRVVDVDILLFGDRTMHTDRLTIPHPEISRRAFVLVPLAEIAPDLVEPVSQQTISQLRDKVPGLESVRLIGPYQAPKRSSSQGSASL